MKKLINDVAEFLMMHRQFDDRQIARSYMYIMGNKIEILEYLFVDLRFMKKIHSIYAAPAVDIETNNNVPMFSVTYEDDSEHGREYSCRKLAIKVVREMLPNLSAEARMELNNLEVEELLSEF